MTELKQVVIQPGNTMWGISQKTGVPVSQIKDANPDADPKKLQIGQILYLQKAKSDKGNQYSIQEGDTFWKISQETGIPLAQLLEANKGLDPKKLQIGQTVNLTAPAETKKAKANTPAVTKPSTLKKSKPTDAQIAITKNKIITEAKKQGVNPIIALAVAKQESQFNQNSVSKSGAKGLFQLMPKTAKELGVNRDNADENIKGGIKYIKYLTKYYKGDNVKALAAYNYGMGNVNKLIAKEGHLNLTKLPNETKDYLIKVSKNVQLFKAEYSKAK